MSRLALLVLLLCAIPVGADWSFRPPITVSAAPRPDVFHHLEAAGRRSLAVGERSVAVVWEDNRDGRPQVYAAFKALAAPAFSQTLKLSESGDAYEPAVAALDGGRFLFAWEEAGTLRLRVSDGAELGPVLIGDTKASAQVTLVAAEPNIAYVAWVHRTGRFGRIMVAQVEVVGAVPKLRDAQPVEAAAPTGDQLYPALAIGTAGLVVAWEDRRHGHTRLYSALQGPGGAFGAPRLLNEQPEARNPQYGRGTGVTRVALAAGGTRLGAAWMDKRDFEGGYDIYAALSEDGGTRFGANELVQDWFGENQPQWHPSIALRDDGLLTVAWDDPRDETPDIWLSWRSNGAWSDDLAVPGASGPGAQEHPAMAFDDEGRLHLAWVERQAAGTRIRYCTGVLRDRP